MDDDDVLHVAVRNMLAREEIRQLPFRYAAALESADVEAMVELFVPHARFGDHGTGPDGLRRLMAQSLENTVFVVILVANHLIEVADAQHATGQVWAQCFAQTSAGFVEQLIRYDDRYEKHCGYWRFTRRRHRLYYGVQRQPSPLRQSAADWPRRQIGVGDLPLAAPGFLDWWEDTRP